MNKMIVFLGILFSIQAKADEATAKLFALNNEKIFVGVNSITNSECSVYFKETTLYYSFENGFNQEEVNESLNDVNYSKHLNSISTGHFYKKFFSNTIVSDSGGTWSFSCLYTGNCRRSQLKLIFDSSSRPKSLSYSSGNEELKLKDLCQF